MPGKQTVQGLVTLYDATPETGGLTVLPGSHREFVDVCKRSGVTGKMQFVNVRKDDPIFKDIPRGRLVQAKAGDLLLWDSRCIHCNTPGRVSQDTAVPSKAQIANELIRFAVYICMTPRWKCSEEVIKYRQKCFRHGVTTSHWPFMKSAMAQSRPLPGYTRPKKTRVIRELVGYPLSSWSQRRYPPGTFRRWVCWLLAVILRYGKLILGAPFRLLCVGLVASKDALLGR